MENEVAAADVYEAEQRPKPGYWLTRFMILRLLGFIYAIAFMVAIQQAVP